MERNRTAFIESLEFCKEIGLYPNFRNAFLACLSPNEVCNILDLNFNQSPKLRQSILKKICLDMTNDFVDCHEELLETLLYLVEQKRCPNRNSVAFCLSEIATSASQLYKEKIIQTFLASSFVGIRKRGLNLLYLHWNLAFENQIVSVWYEYRDLIAAKLIIENFPSEFLELHFLELESQLKQRPQMRLLLYKRTFPASTKYLPKLAQDDGITYAYICAKMGIVLSPQKAKLLVKRYSTDERVGILIWALGIMKHWEILAEMYKNN